MQGRLVEAGMKAEDAEGILVKMCDGEPRLWPMWSALSSVGQKCGHCGERL